MASFDIDNHCRKLQICSRQGSQQPSSSKTVQVGGDIPGPGRCSSPVCGKLKEQRRKKPAAYCRYTPALPYSSTSNPLHSLPPLEHSEPGTPVALCSWSAARLLQCSLCDVQLGTVLCDLQTGPQSSKGAGANLHSLPVFGRSHCTYRPRTAECLHKLQISHTPSLPLQRRERPKPVAPRVNVMNMNSLRILRILLKALQTSYLLFGR